MPRLSHSSQYKALARNYFHLNYPACEDQRKQKICYTHSTSGFIDYLSGMKDALYAKQQSPEAISLKEELLHWVFSILGAIIFYLIVAFITLAVYHPDVDALKEEAKRLLLTPSISYPKPVESLLFHLSIVTILPGLLVFYFLFSKIKWLQALADKKFFLFFSILCTVTILAMIYFDFAAPTPPDNGNRFPVLDGVRDINFNFFFDGFFLGNYLLVYTLVVMPSITCLFFIGIKNHHWENKKVFKIALPLLGYTIIGAALTAIVAMNTFLYPYSTTNKYDFNAVYYSMTQVYAGLPMLVNGFTNTYGLYPHFLNPLFQLTGLDVLKFSLVMSLLLGLSFSMNFYAVKKFVNNQVIFFLACATALFFPYLNFKMITEFDCYFALFPIRYIIPSTLLLLATVYFLKPTIRIYWLTGILMAFFALWNPEIGLVCYLSWIVANLYFDFYSREGKINFLKMLLHILAGICLLPIVFYAYKLLIYLFYGASPDLGLLWKATFVFGKVGLMNHPLSLVHPWNLVALILITGFMYAIVQWHHKATTPKSAIVLLLSLIGLGYFFYFEGRCQNVTLSAGSGFCILLLAILADELWQIIRKNNIFLLNALFVIALFLISFSFIELVYSADKISKLVVQEDDKTAQLNEQRNLEGSRDFFLNNTQEHEPIFLMNASKFQGLYFNGNKRVAAFNPGIIDLFFNADLKRYEDILRDSSFPVFIEPTSFYYSYMQPAIAEVGALYEYKAAHKSMALLKKRTIPIPPTSFFNHSERDVFYRKYNDDTTGLGNRINDAFGVPPVTLNPEFSAQVLFFSEPQVYPYAALVGNLKDSRGFVINNIFNSANYYIVVNNKGFTIPMKYFNWSYLAVNIYPDHLDVYVNGALSGSFTLSQPISQSDDKLYVGNLGAFHDYFIGAIAEVEVENTVVTKEQIRETWNQIASAIINKK